MKVIYSQSNNPYLNLALENDYFVNLEDQEFLFLYKNKPSVVYGRFQNPWLECNIQKMLEDKILFVRRQSGGGCVYHDLGNLNFCFLSQKTNYSKENNLKLMLRFLGDHSDIIINKRYDLRFIKDDKDFKISGSAFKEKKNTALHHCTLLINSDLTKLNNYLSSYMPDIISNSSKSVRSTVFNLSDYINESSVLNNIENILNEKILYISESDIEKRLRDDEFLEQMRSNQWIFDETPLFEYDSDLYQLKMKKGIVLEFNLKYDAHPSLQAEIDQILTNLHIQDFLAFLNKNNSFSFYAKEKEAIVGELRNFVQVYLFKI